jgi:hypothetical protein
VELRLHALRDLRSTTTGFAHCCKDLHFTNLIR